MTNAAVPCLGTPVDTRISARTLIGSASETLRRRVLYIEANEDGTVGGSHQALFDLVRHLDRSRYEPVLLFYQNNVFADRARKLDLEVHLFDTVREAEREVHLSGRKMAKVVELIAAVARRYLFLQHERIDLIHINNSPRVGNDDWLPAARLLRIPIIASAMGDAHPEPSRLRSWLFRCFDAVLPVSDYIYDAMRRKGIPEQRLRKVHHGVAVGELRDRVRRSRGEVRRELGIPEESVMVAMVANIREWKGQHVVLRALQKVDSETRARLRVLFVGACNDEHRPYLGRLQAMVEDLGLKEAVSFLGGRADVPDIYNAADIALHASITPEPGGIAVLEAMALGKAVVAANRGGHVEYLIPNYGLLHDVESPGELARILTRLVAEAEERVRLGEAARERVKEFSIERNALETQNIYDRFLMR